MRTTEADDDGPRADDAAAGVARPSPRLPTRELHALLDDSLPVAEAAQHPTPAGAVGREPEPSGEPAPPPPRAASEAYIGVIVDRRYQIEQLIAAGGMGLVYRCRHSVLGKKLAIKIIRADVAQMPDGHERFLLEAKAASSIGNEHIVDIMDFGALPDGSPYLVMEYLEGISLSHLMRREPELSVERISRIVRQIAEGLGAAHAAGIVHRDLKPDNVFILDKRGADFVKILDFGVARMAQSAKKLTQAGTIVGTPHYMSPEQAAGKDVDHRGDIYALGVMIFELCSGRVPFDGDHYLSVLHQHLREEPPRLAELDPPVRVPDVLEDIIARCLAKAPEARYPTMAELRDDLAPLAGEIVSRRASEPPLDPSPDAQPAPGPARLLEAEPARGPTTPPPPSPTAILPAPAPTPTLVLPRPTGPFNAVQRRAISGAAIAVLLMTGVWAVWTATRETSPPRPEHTPPPAPTVTAAPKPPTIRPLPTPPVVAAPPVAAEATKAEPAKAEPATAESATAEPSRAESATAAPAAEAPARPAASPAERTATPSKREPRPAARPSKPRQRDEFMNPWPVSPARPK
jgi:serine/threonine-protein kinase